MNPIVVHIASGASFFIGTVLLLVGLWVVAPKRGRWIVLAGRITGVVGLIAAYVSASPWPVGVLPAAVVLGLAGLLLGSSERRPRTRRWLRLTACGTWCVLAVPAILWQLLPRIPPVDVRRMDVIGDSITAGVGGERTWPDILAADHDVDVRNHARVGATVRSAMRQAEAIEPGPTLVLLEIGGNDLLGSTTPADYERDLDRLLATAGGPGRVLVLLELPCPPTYERFGRIARRVAGRHGAHVVPRRILLGVIAGEAATLDSIHLTEEGQHRMAEAVWSVVRGAFEQPG